MTVPKPFEWPTPWLWGAILLMVIVESNGFFDAIVSICVVTIAASVICFLRGGFSGLRRTETVSHLQPTSDSLATRLAEIERRLTDTQDVMIALSERVDRWDEERRQAEISP